VTAGNPPHDNPPNDDNQWWSTPASTSPGAPLTGTDPTVLGGNQQYGSSGYAQYPGQTYAQPTPGPQRVAASHPGYAGQQYATGYTQQPARPPQRNKTPWIIGGVIGLVAIVGLVLTVVAVNVGHNASDSLLGKKNMNGNYAITNVTNACSLVDLTVLSQWAPNPKPNPEHTERASDGVMGGSLSCNAGYDGAGQYSTEGAELDLDAELVDAYGSPDYNMWKDEDTKTTGSGRDSGTLTGLGEQSYYATEAQNYSSFNVLDYTCATLDSNLSVKVKLHIEADDPPNTTTAGTTCKEQLQKVLTALHK
jgi:hypothetical protein